MEIFHHVYQNICYFSQNNLGIQDDLIIMKCKWCDAICKKDGKQKNGRQKYRCTSCGVYQQSNYIYKACTKEIHDQFSRMSRLGCGTNKMASFLRISINTLQKWIWKANDLQPVQNLESDGIYDIDEIQTCVGKKSDKIWITYGWDVTN